MKLNEIVLLEGPTVTVFDAAKIEKWSEWKAIKKELQDSGLRMSKKFNDMKTGKRFFVDGSAENFLKRAGWEQGKAEVKRAQDTARMSFDRSEVFTNEKYEAKIGIDSSSRGFILVLRIPPGKAPR